MDEYNPYEDSLRIVDKRPNATEKANWTGNYNPYIISSIAKHAINQGVNPYTALAVSLRENNLGKAFGVTWGAWQRDYNKPISEEETSLLNKSKESSDIHDNQIKRLDNLKYKYRDMRDEIKGEVGNSFLGSNKDYFDIPEYKSVVSKLDDIYKYTTKLNYDFERTPEIADINAYHFISTLKDKLDYGKKIKGVNATEPMLIQAYNGYGKTNDSRTGKVIDMTNDPVYGNSVMALRKYAIENNPTIKAIVGALYPRN